MATNPSRDILDEIAALNGQPRVSYENADTTFPQTERMLELLRGKAPLEYLSAEPDPARFADLKLIEQAVIGSNQTHLKLYCKYGKVLGPVLQTPSRLDDDAATVTVTTQRKAVADIVTNETLTGAGPYVWTRSTKGEGNNIVATQVVETRGIPGNEKVEYLYDKDLGPTERRTQLVRAADTTGGGSTSEPSAGVISKIQYLDVPGSVLVKRKVTETYTTAGCVALTKQQYDAESDTFVLITRTIKKTNAITEGITLYGPGDNTITLIESEPIDKLMSTEVSTTWTLPAANSETIDTGPTEPIVTNVEHLPYPFPFVMNDLDKWILTGGLLGYSPAFTTRVPHISRTHWKFSASPPTVTLNGILTLATIDNLFGNGFALTDLVVDGGTDYFLGGVTITVSASIPAAAEYAAQWVDGEASPRGILGDAKRDGNRYRWRVDRKFIKFIEQAKPTYT